MVKVKPELKEGIAWESGVSPVDNLLPQVKGARIVVGARVLKPPVKVLMSQCRGIKVSIRPGEMDVPAMGEVHAPLIQLVKVTISWSRRGPGRYFLCMCLDCA